MKQTTIKYAPFLVSAVLAWVVLYIIFPYYRYYIDPDATSYLTIAARYAAGDFQKAVNGLWSPWACWLTALLMKAGMQPVTAGIVVNAAAGTGFMFIAQSLFLRFSLPVFTQWVFSGTLAVFVCFAVFWQTFDDLWQCFFMLAILRIIIADGFANRPGLWVAIGMVGALSYFAKAYSVPYFVLSVICCAWLLTGRNVFATVKIVAVSTIVMLACSFPWLYAIHDKYGIWTTSTAGGLNMSWYLVGHPEWKESINVLLPPVYEGSPYYWEDPYVANGHLSHFWDSWYLFGRMGLRLVYNFLTLLVCMLQLSVVFPVVSLLILAKLFLRRRFPNVTMNEQVIYASFLLLPAGYIMVHLESRYLWYMVPIALIACALFLQGYSFSTEVVRKRAILLVAVSFCLFPVWGLKKLYREGEKEYNYAVFLNRAGFKGIDIVSNLHPRLLSKIAYFSGNRFYVVSKQKVPEVRVDVNKERSLNTTELVKDIKRYGVGYYLYAPANSGKLKNPGFDDLFFENLKDSTGIIADKPLLVDEESGLRLYKL